MTQTSPTPKGSTCNLVSIGPAVSEEMLFENVDEADADNANEGQQTIVCPLSSPETFGSGELRMLSVIWHSRNIIICDTYFCRNDVLWKMYSGK